MPAAPGVGPPGAPARAGGAALAGVTATTSAAATSTAACPVPRRHRLGLSAVMGSPSWLADPVSHLATGSAWSGATWYVNADIVARHRPIGYSRHADGVGYETNQFRNPGRRPNFVTTQSRI
ncbi:hypothetical protein GCM10009635_05760 [Actinocatenispora thailandica]